MIVEQLHCVQVKSFEGWNKVQKAGSPSSATIHCPPHGLGELYNLSLMKRFCQFSVEEQFSFIFLQVETQINDEALFPVSLRKLYEL